jgi:nucleoside-diphosphate-sugar epimerase
MKYLVLGSEGQIGKPLCNYLKERGHTVLTYDIAASIDQDLRREPTNELRKLIDASDFVFFLAFDVGGSLYLKRYEKSLPFLQNNSDIMRNTFSLLDCYKKPFIFASSQMSNMLYSPYGVLKQLGEHYTRSLGGLTIKFWNVYGPEEDPEKTHVVTDFVKMAQKGKIECRTSGEEVRQFLYVEDACEALHNLSDQYYNIDPEEALHITSFEWSSVKQVGEILADEFKCDLSFATATDEVQKDARNEADNNIFKYWKPTTSLESGLKKIIEYYESV